MDRRTNTLSARNCAASLSRPRASVQYRKIPPANSNEKPHIEMSSASLVVMDQEALFTPSESSCFENIPNTTYSVYEFSRGLPVHLPSQPTDRDIEKVGVTIEIDVPDMGRNEGASKHLSRTSHHQR